MTMSFYLIMNARYLDQLGMASRYKTKVYCRQTLVGGNYGLLNTTTLVPNPDYYRQVHGTGFKRIQNDQNNLCFPNRTV